MTDLQESKDPSQGEDRNQDNDDPKQTSITVAITAATNTEDEDTIHCGQNNALTDSNSDNKIANTESLPLAESLPANPEETDLNAERNSPLNKNLEETFVQTYIPVASKYKEGLFRPLKVPSQTDSEDEITMQSKENIQDKQIRFPLDSAVKNDQSTMELKHSHDIQSTEVAEKAGAENDELGQNEEDNSGREEMIQGTPASPTDIYTAVSNISVPTPLSVNNDKPLSADCELDDVTLISGPEEKNSDVDDANRPSERLAERLAKNFKKDVKSHIHVPNDWSEEASTESLQRAAYGKSNSMTEPCVDSFPKLLQDLRLGCHPGWENISRMNATALTTGGGESKTLLQTWKPLCSMDVLSGTVIFGTQGKLYHTGQDGLVYKGTGTLYLIRDISDTRVLMWDTSNSLLANHCIYPATELVYTPGVSPVMSWFAKDYSQDPEYTGWIHCKFPSEFTAQQFYLKFTKEKKNMDRWFIDGITECSGATNSYVNAGGTVQNDSNSPDQRVDSMAPPKQDLMVNFMALEHKNHGSEDVQMECSIFEFYFYNLATNVPSSFSFEEKRWLYRLRNDTFPDMYAIHKYKNGILVNIHKRSRRVTRTARRRPRK